MAVGGGVADAAALRRAHVRAAVPANEAQRRRAAAIADGVLAMRLVDLFWLVLPAFDAGVRIHWLTVAALVALGGLFMVVFFGQLARYFIVPRHDPQLPVPERDLSAPATLPDDRAPVRRLV